MLVPLLLLTTVGWGLLQWRPRRKRVWARRWVPVEPVVVTVITDVIVTWRYLRSFKLRQIVNANFWRERLQFKKLWQDYQDY